MAVCLIDTPEHLLLGLHVSTHLLIVRIGVGRLLVEAKGRIPHRVLVLYLRFHIDVRSQAQSLYSFKVVYRFCAGICVLGADASEQFLIYV